MSFGAVGGIPFTQSIPERGEVFPGLTSTPRSEWPAIGVSQFQRPIERLTPNSKLHNRVLNYLIERIFNAERSMGNFHGRWRANEMRNQAWIDLRKFDKILKDANDKGKPPLAVDIVVPYSFATLSTISTYLLQTFAGHHPFMQVGTYGMNVQNAMQMEIVLQYQMDHNRIIRWWHRWFNDMGLYGVGILINRWMVETQMRTRPREVPVLDITSGQFAPETIRDQQEVVTYEGNEVFSLDPFMFFPDPRVPMSEVAQKGEHVTWRQYQGKHLLKRQETQGLLKWVDQAPETVERSSQAQLISARNLLHGGDPHAGSQWTGRQLTGPGNYQVDTCSIDLVPRELGLGESDKMEKWIFTILNNAQIAQAERQLDDHGEHPVNVAEPFGSGYDFGSAGMADYIGPLQDSMSWFLNSHMENVRSALNNQWVVDPFSIEMRDVNRPGPGKTIRLKRTALNRDVSKAIQQLPVQDVTRGHITDMDTFFEIGQRVSSVSENLLGVQDQGGRKTATEVRTAGQSAASRLASLTRVVSAQGMTSLTNQMSLNTQQWMSQDFHVRITGQDGQLHPLLITPDGIAGDYYYPIHDGTLPMDKVALLDIWKQLLVGMLQDPEIRAAYSVPKLFEFVAELGGAKNIKSFRIQPGSQESIQQQQSAGNLAPIPGANSPSGLVNATLPQPGNRITSGQST